MKQNPHSRTTSQYALNHHTLGIVFNLESRQQTPSSQKTQQDLKFSTFMFNSRVHPKGLQYMHEKPKQYKNDQYMAVFRSKQGRARSKVNKSQPSIGSYQVSFQAVEPHTYHTSINNNYFLKERREVSSQSTLFHDTEVSGTQENEFRSTSFAKQLSRIQAHRYRSWAPDLYQDENKMRELDDQITPEELVRKINKQYFISNQDKKPQVAGNSNVCNILMEGRSYLQPQLNKLPFNKDEMRNVSIKTLQL